MSEAAKVTGIKLKYIYNCIDGNGKTSGGYIWKRIII
jgi:hypothetical protein